MGVIGIILIYAHFANSQVRSFINDQYYGNGIAYCDAYIFGNEELNWFVDINRAFGNSINQGATIYYRRMRADKPDTLTTNEIDCVDVTIKMRIGAKGFIDADQYYALDTKSFYVDTNTSGVYLIDYPDTSKLSKTKNLLTLLYWNGMNYELPSTYDSVSNSKGITYSIYYPHYNLLQFIFKGGTKNGGTGYNREWVLPLDSISTYKRCGTRLKIWVISNQIKR